MVKCVILVIVFEFNLCWNQYRPVRLYGIEPSDANDNDTDLPQMSAEPGLAEVLGQLDAGPDADADVDLTRVMVDRNYEYTVWLSYVEVYNEKVYDLLDSIKDESSDPQPTPKTPADPRLLLTRKALPLRPSPASDNGDTEINGKYIAGLRQFRVTSAAQAKSIVKLGQLHRRVFGTLANHQSSRSHGMVIVKIVRGHRGERDVSRCTLLSSMSPNPPNRIQLPFKYRGLRLSIWLDRSARSTLIQLVND
jgi:kinesin family protein 20